MKKNSRKVEDTRDKMEDRENDVEEEGEGKMEKHDKAKRRRGETNHSRRKA